MSYYLKPSLYNDFPVCAKVLLNYTYEGKDRSVLVYTSVIKPNGTQFASYHFQESNARDKYSSDFQCKVGGVKKLIK